MDFPIKNGDFPLQNVSLPEGNPPPQYLVVLHAEPRPDLRPRAPLWLRLGRTPRSLLAAGTTAAVALLDAVPWMRKGCGCVLWKGFIAYLYIYIHTIYSVYIYIYNYNIYIYIM